MLSEMKSKLNFCKATSIIFSVKLFLIKIYMLVIGFYYLHRLQIFRSFKCDIRIKMTIFLIAIYEEYEYRFI